MTKSHSKSVAVFLRGINVGGNKKVPMARLRELLAANGFADPRTYIQSGNIILDDATATPQLETSIERIIRKDFGFDVPVIARPSSLLNQALRKCPFAKAAEERPNLVGIGFAKDKVARSAASKAKEFCTAGEQVIVQGQMIWIDYGGGIARSKLSPAAMDRAFGSTVTVRNIRTLRALVKMVEREP